MKNKVLDSEIIPYLAHGIFIEILNYKCDYVGIKYAKANGFYYLNGEIHVTYDGGSTGKSINDFRPLVYSLDLLDKEVFYKGETFNPAVRLALNKRETLSIKAWGVTSPEMSYDRMQKLMEWKFDIYGWLYHFGYERHNQATNIRDLQENPYETTTQKA